MTDVKHFEEKELKIILTDDNLTNNIKSLYPSVFLVCFRSKNKNVVIYEALINKEGKFQDIPIDGYWLILEPSYQEIRKKQGINNNREEFSWIDKKFAWGFEQKRISDYEAQFSFTQFPDLLFTIKLDLKKNAKMFILWKENKYYVQSFYIDVSDNVNVLNFFNPEAYFKKLVFNCVNITTKSYKNETIEFTSIPKLE